MVIKSIKTFWKRITGQEARTHQAQIQKLQASLAFKETSWELVCDILQDKDSKERALRNEAVDLAARIAILEYGLRQKDKHIASFQDDVRARWEAEAAYLARETLSNEQMFDLAGLENDTREAA